MPPQPSRFHVVRFVQVTVDVKTDKSGTITSLFADIEDNVAVGSKLFDIELGNFVAAAEASAATADSSQSGELYLVKVPPMGDSISGMPSLAMFVATDSSCIFKHLDAEGSLIEWVRNVGDSVAVDDTVAILETDKVAKLFDAMSDKGNNVSCRSRLM
jgi:pyruvate/2-oxoglutarate dehydrogenase complex dihydrolipoamide acyltransferase (E2) component